MNINNYKDELINEEQKILEELIYKMNKDIDKLSSDVKKQVLEAKRAIESYNVDEYKNIVDANKIINEKNEKKGIISFNKKALYESRLLLKTYQDNKEGIKEIKVGLHTCRGNNETYIYDWKTDVCRHYLLDNPSAEFHGIVEDNKGIYETDYTLLIRDDVKIQTGYVSNVVNRYPISINENTINELRKSKFFSNEFCNKLSFGVGSEKKKKVDNKKKADNKKKVKVEETIIADEFLQELIERRSTPEFKNIIFSIQRLQGEIIQVPYDKNMIVQGCAGSGKSMIMMHRIPIVLFDNPRVVSRKSIYVISPSLMYIQMAKNMRDDLEISDIEMGTIEQYYDVCIDRYVGHNFSEYGELYYHREITKSQEKYIYSSECIDDIRNYFDEICSKKIDDEDKFYNDLKIERKNNTNNGIYSKTMKECILNIEKLLNRNKTIIAEYYKNYRMAMGALFSFSKYIKETKDRVKSYYNERLSMYEIELENALREIEELDPENNNIAIISREELIDLKRESIIELNNKIDMLDSDDYFINLDRVSEKIDMELQNSPIYKKEFSKADTKDVYRVIDNIGNIIGLYYMIKWDLTRIEKKYESESGSIDDRFNEIHKVMDKIQLYTENYLDYNHLVMFENTKEELLNLDSNAVKQAYTMILNKLGLNNKNNENIAYKFSPYLYLQTMYQYYGQPAMNGNTLINIDEAQNMSKEEYRLIKHINGEGVILNLFGDVNQHIEDSKGISSWNELDDITNFKTYNIRQNYRNASQITEYCNGCFGMNMQAINTFGNGVKEIRESDELEKVIKNYLSNKKIGGLKAIIVKNADEARMIVDKYQEYKAVINDMSGDVVALNNKKWNIILIEDAKGLEFKTAIVISGNMSKNEKYIAYTRALDELIVYDEMREEHPPIVEKFDRDVYYDWARYLGLLDEKNGGVRKKDRYIIYEHMYGNIKL